MPASPTRNLVTGGAGFLRSHLVDRLMEAGEEVICHDNYFTGRNENVRQWIGHPRFELIRHDVTLGLERRVGARLLLASTSEVYVVGRARGRNLHFSSDVEPASAALAAGLNAWTVGEG